MTATPLLTTKLYIPPVRTEWVRRPRLFERLQNGLHLGHKLLLISAPAGFGKTTLLSTWIQDNLSDIQVSWLSLDEDDNDLGRFFTYLIAALEQIDQDIGHNLSAVLQASTTPQPKPLLSVLVHELNVREDEFVLVLDDYHTIHNHDVHDALDFLIEHLPGNTHLVVSGRIEPPLPLSRLRVRDQMTEIRPTDLRLTPSETTALLNGCFALNLDPHDVAALEARTEGWVASLQLAALSLQDCKDKHDFVAAFSGSHRYVIDYLVDEVMAHQSNDLRRFLRQTSILNRLCAPLCNAVMKTDHSQATLEHLDRANLFVVPLDDRRKWYRYHHLFADMLRARLQIESPDIGPLLHRRAAEWYAAQKLTAEAVHHALAARAYDLAAQWIAETVTDAFRRGQVSRVRRWLEALPEEIVHNTPLLALSHAWVSVIALDAHKIDDYMDRLEHLLRTAPADSSEIRAIWLSNAMAIRSTRALHLNRVEQVIAYAEEGLALLSDKQEFQHQLRSVLGYNLAFAYAIQGQVDRACRAYEQAIDEARRAEHVIIVAFGGYHLGELYRLCGRLRDAVAVHQQTLDSIESMVPSSPLLGMLHVGLGAVRCEQFELSAAQTHLETGIEHCQRAGIAEIATEGYRWLACVHQARKESTQTQTALDAAHQMYRSLNHIEGTVRATLCQARHHLARGELEKIGQWIAEYEPLRNASDEIVQAEALTLALAHLASGDIAQASILLAQLKSALMQSHIVDPVSVAILEALVEYRQGQQGRALAALGQALQHAAPENHIRPFVNAGQPMYEMLNAHATSSNPHSDFVNVLLVAFDNPSPSVNKAKSTASRLDEPLSKREMDVLRLIAAGLKYKEIAEQLFISVNTVNYHIKNLYGKLGVRNRTQAIARANHLDLLS
jgi:LuxR family maltose regulon positive regulatory protein